MHQGYEEAKVNTTLIESFEEFAFIGSLFDGKKIRLEKLFTATQDGFDGVK